MSLPSVEQARRRMLAAVEPRQAECVALDDALGRVVREDVRAERNQPPFPASAMDGWAVRRADASAEEVSLEIVGGSAAGHGWDGTLVAGQAVRISTGAPVPNGADCVVVQEEARRDAGQVRVGPLNGSNFIRPRGADFAQGDVLLRAGARLDPSRIALLAAAGRASVMVGRRPRLAVVPSGDEVVAPGAAAGPWQIYDSAGFGLAAWGRARGAEVARLDAMSDDPASVTQALANLDCEVIVTIGGASVGDHDVVKPALAALGLDLIVDGIAVRPGKPSWFGTLPDGRLVLGLPGNPVSAMVCAELFLGPLIDALQGAPWAPRFHAARLSAPLAANGPREHYLRCTVSLADGVLSVAPASNQDSSLITVLAAAGGLIRRLPKAAAAAEGDLVETLLLDRHI